MIIFDYLIKLIASVIMLFFCGLVYVAFQQYLTIIKVAIIAFLLFVVFLGASILPHSDPDKSEVEYRR